MNRFLQTAAPESTWKPAAAALGLDVRRHDANALVVRGASLAAYLALFDALVPAGGFAFHEIGGN